MQWYPGFAALFAAHSIISGDGSNRGLFPVQNIGFLGAKTKSQGLLFQPFPSPEGSVAAQLSGWWKNATIRQYQPSDETPT